MAGIKGKNTLPELAIRKALHRRGYRYVLHSETVPGKPDLVFPARRAVIFIHGCFWHGHDCRFFRLPSTRPEFWQAKIQRNAFRDAKVRGILEEENWRFLTIWECAIRGKGTEGIEKTADLAAKWLDGHLSIKEIRGE